MRFRFLYAIQSLKKWVSSLKQVQINQASFQKPKHRAYGMELGMFYHTIKIFRIHVFLPQIACIISYVIRKHYKCPHMRLLLMLPASMFTDGTQRRHYWRPVFRHPRIALYSGSSPSPIKQYMISLFLFYTIRWKKLRRHQSWFRCHRVASVLAPDDTILKSNLSSSSWDILLLKPRGKEAPNRQVPSLWSE